MVKRPLKIQPSRAALRGNLTESDGEDVLSPTTNEVGEAIAMYHVGIASSLMLLAMTAWQYLLCKDSVIKHSSAKLMPTQ